MRDAIVEAVAGADNCAAVTVGHLVQIAELQLSFASLTEVQAGDFAGLAGLTTLNLFKNKLGSLPSGVFDGLASLETLLLHDNRLLELPGNVFADLPVLADLRLDINPGYPFGPVADAGLSQTVTADAGVTLNGTGGGDPWGRAVSYAWTQTDTSGAVVALAGADTATPEFPAPAREAETPLEFTLAVTAINPGGVAPPGTTIAGDVAKDTAHVLVLAAELVSVSFFRTNYTATEGGSEATVAVRLDRSPRRTVTIPLTAIHGGGADAGDYSMPTGVTFRFADRQQFFTVTANDDTEDDDGESVEIGFGALPGAVSVGDPSTTTVTLVDDDLPTGTSVVDVAITSDPGTDAIYGIGDVIQATVTFEAAVTVTATPQLTLTVGSSVTVLLGRAARNADYMSGSGSRKLVFAYTVAAGDNDPDGVSISADSLALNNGTIIDGGGEAVVLLHPEVGAQSGHLVDTAAPVLGDVFVNGPELTIRYSEALDESSVPAANRFEVYVEDDLRTVSAVAVNDDLVTLTLASAVIPGEGVRATYIVPATNPVRDRAGSAAAAFANRTVTNNSVPTVSIMAVDSAVYEGADVDFTLARNGPPTGALTVRVRVGDSGDVLEQWEVYRQATFAAASAEALLTVFTLNDHDYEPHAEVTATVDGAGGYYASGPSGAAHTTVLDNDLPDVDLRLESPESVGEAAGEITVRIRAATVLDQEPHRHLRVQLSSTGQTAVSGSGGDFDLIDEWVQLRLEDFERIMLDGEPRYVASVERQVGIHDDTVSEEDETFALQLTRPGIITFGVTLPDAPHVVTILDDDNNNFATGAPTITGTVQVGEVLTATTGGIMDADGKPANAADYTYQWLDGGDDTPIAGATGMTYTPVVGDEGKTLKVKVSFTDGGGNPEERTSDATAAVAAATKLTDATLSGLGLAGATLSDPFASDTTAYMESVANTVTQITLAPTTTDDGASIEYLDGSDMALTDASGTDNGFQVNLAVGANVIKVKVTAEDGTTQTYTLTVTREAGNAAPTFGEGGTAGRRVAENTATETDFGAALTATDADSDTLTYGLDGTDAASFDIDTGTGQLKTNVALNFENKTRYTVDVTVTDGKNAGGAADGSVRGPAVEP